MDAEPSRLDRLESLRDYLERQMDDAGPREAAGLAGRYVEVLREIDAMPSPAVVSPLDEIAKRREERRAGAGQ